MVSLKFLFSGDALRWTKIGHKQFITHFCLIRLFIEADPPAVTRVEKAHLVALNALCNPWASDRQEAT